MGYRRTAENVGSRPRADLRAEAAATGAYGMSERRILSSGLERSDINLAASSSCRHPGSPNSALRNS